MTYADYAWECECGYIEYGEDASEKCPKCHAIDSFVKLPEEEPEEKSKEEFGDEL
ncbi:MAG: rubredoxin-like domain-containing protein [Nanoarchaeota archaeon]